MYTKFYGFSEKPFEVTPDPKFLYLTPSHQETLDAMIDGIKNRRGLVCVTGEAGTGKTTLIYALLSTLNIAEHGVRTVYIFHSTITFKELLRNILMELHLREEGERETLQHRLTQYLTQVSADETIATIIDEAQHLPKEVIEEFPLLLDLRPKAIQILLSGQPELEEKLRFQSLRPLRERISVTCQVRALTEEEAKEYVDHRLRVVGASASQVFTPEALSMICLHGNGIPRTINILCDNALLTGYSLSKKEIDGNILRQVIKNMEGPTPKKRGVDSVTKASKAPRAPATRLSFFTKRISLAILCLLCFGGLFLAARDYLQRKPTGTLSLESSKSPQADVKSSSTSPSPQDAGERGIKEESSRPTGEQEVMSSESPQPVLPPPPSLPMASQPDLLQEVVVVEEGHTLSHLAQKYYRMVNPTLLDLILTFNTEITNADIIRVNQKIKIPKIAEELLILHSPDRTYKVYVGTFWNPGQTRIFSDEPALTGKTIEAIPRHVSPQETWYRIVVGDFKTRDEALKVIRLLRERGLLHSFGGIR